MSTDIVGNTSLVSNDEEKLAQFLKDRNLDKTNANDLAVVPANNVYGRYIKRIIDLLIGIPAFVATLPLNLIFGICTYFDVGRPVFYKQTRIGRDGKPFTMVKFRNMNNNTDKDGKLLPANQRVTRFGKFMRKFSLDELLNFWSVIRGDMSIIGPRPMPAFFVDRMSERHKMRHVVRPGLECPRVYVPEGENLTKYHCQFENDVWYVEHISFLTDLKMCLMLVKLVFQMKVRGKRAGGNAASYFVGYDDEGHALHRVVAEEQYRELMKGSNS